MILPNTNFVTATLDQRSRHEVALNGCLSFPATAEQHGRQWNRRKQANPQQRPAYGLALIDIEFVGKQES
jgi:hypothetical protein